VLYNGRNLIGMRAKELEAIRGAQISMVFQDPMTFLDPVMRVGDQIIEALRVHTTLNRAERQATALELMRHVGIPLAERRMRDYPHQFSGGMRQRVLIAMALACKPKILLADEPTTALDVTIQDQILSLLLQLQRELGMSVLLVSHDLGVIAQTCERVAVMYAGQIVELGDTATLLTHPRHPYTLGLLRSLPGGGTGSFLTVAQCGWMPAAPGRRNSWMLGQVTRPGAYGTTRLERLMGDCSDPCDPCDPLGAATDEIGNNWEQPLIG
jgi:peptide/nickel transport system ATP-binding protein/oligopeptide transport system ATP-binding protein